MNQLANQATIDSTAIPSNTLDQKSGRAAEGEAIDIMHLGCGNAYQIFTRSAGARYIRSPACTLNVRRNASLFTSGTNAR